MTVDWKRQHNEGTDVCHVHKTLYFCGDQIKSGMGSACGKRGRRKGEQRFVMGQPDGKRTEHRKLKQLADMKKVFSENYYKSNAIIV